jgi:hypothetical protein
VSDDADGEIELVAFGFAHLDDAAAVEWQLRAILDVGPDDLALRAVGGTPEFVDGAAFVVAGRIRSDRMKAAEQVVERHGGEVLTDVPEAWAGLPRDGGRA